MLPRCSVTAVADAPQPHSSSVATHSVAPDDEHATIRGVRPCLSQDSKAGRVPPVGERVVSEALGPPSSLLPVADRGREVALVLRLLLLLLEAAVAAM